MGFYLGGYAMWDHNNPEFLIASDDAHFFAQTCQDPQMIDSADVGRRLLAMISQQCKGIGPRKRAVSLSVKIAEAWSELDTEQEDDSKYDGLRSKRREGLNYRVKGVGTGSTVQYRNSPEMEAIYTTYIGVKSPPYTMLAHELIHALHSLSGDNRGLYVPSSQAPDADWKHEEARTVGISIYENNPISENAIRDEHRLPRRKTYSLDPMSGLTSALADAVGSLNGAVSAELLSHPRFQVV